jgi:Domain of unknown function (DUF4124)
VAKKYLYGIILLIILLQVGWIFAAEIYRWTDETGTVHFTDDPLKIPEKYSDRVEKKKLMPDQPASVEKTESPGTENIPKPEAKEDPVGKYLDEIDRKIETKRSLQKKVSDLEDELRLCDERLKRIEEEEKDYLREYAYLPMIGSNTRRRIVLSSPYEEEKTMLIQKMDSIKKEINSLEEQISMINRSL